MLLINSVPVIAYADTGFTVELIGAGELTPLLNEHLEIQRHRTVPNLGREELQRLVEMTPGQIRELLATEGYFSPVIEQEMITKEGRPLIRFHLNVGKPVTVRSTEIRFSGEIAHGTEKDAQRMNRLRRQWHLETGDIFRQKDWTEAKNTLLKNLLVRDYPAATIVDSEARIDPQQQSATLTVEVDSGPAFTFGALEIEGLSRYPREMVDALNPIQTGDPYSQEKLNELQAQVQGTGYFRSVFASAEIDPLHPKEVPVRLELQENERKRLALGGGFSTDAGARLEMKWLDRHFLSRPWRLESELLVDRETQRVGGRVFLPALPNRWYPAMDAKYERTDIEGELTDKVRLGARISSPVKIDEQTWGVSYLADRQRIGATFSNDRQALIASYGYTRRRLDNLLTPQRGYVISMELGAGLGGVVNASHMGRLVSNATWMSVFNRRWQMVLRGQIGQVFGATRLDVPSDLLFRTGGDQSVRGYAFNSLGVMQDGAIVGSTVSAVMSAELVYRIRPQWGIALFTDAGNAADSWRDMALKRGSGVGARWRSPVGPVNLDLAYGHATHKLRLHFSIGYGF